MPLFVEPFVVVPGFFHVRLRRDHAASTLRSNEVANGFRAVGLVAEHVALRKLCHRKQFNRMDRIVVVPGESETQPGSLNRPQSHKSLCSGRLLNAKRPYLQPFFVAIGALVHLGAGRVDAQVFRISIGIEREKNILKHSTVPPFTKTRIDALLRPIVFRQSTPLRPRTINPQHRVEHHAV